MKNIRNLLIFILVSGFSILTATSQSVILKNFSVSQIDKSVFLQWTISQGETCNGIQVQRSLDSLNFQQIGEVSGVCGSPDFDQPFEYIDTNPVKNQTNYYRLVLGNTGFSEITSIDVFVLTKEGVLILPNPANQTTTVYFKNEYNSQSVFQLFTSVGALVLEMEGRTNYFIINTLDLEAGIYIFKISDTENTGSLGGRISVVH